MKTVAEVKYFPVGWIPGFRVWTLQAFDVNSKLIVEISKDYGSFGNEAKLEDFIYELYEKGYRLTKDQIYEISKALSLNFTRVFNGVKEYAPIAFLYLVSTSIWATLYFMSGLY